MNIKYNPNSKEGYDLMASGGLAFSDMEMNGIRIDVKHFKFKADELSMTLKLLYAKILKTDEGKFIHKKYGQDGFTSSKKLGKALFDDLNYTQVKGRSVDEKVLASFKGEFPEQLLHIRKLEKTLSTYIIGILRQVVHRDGEYVLHPSFSNLLVSSYRSSSQGPNLQNIPVRNEEVKAIVRKGFKARKGNLLLEVDFSGNEVKCGACYHKDPMMIKYITDPTTDMHRDMASECYLLPPDEVSKNTRYCGKNMFVFPQFYGDWYQPCATNMWEAIDTMSLKTSSGVKLKRHLRRKGIDSLEQFIKHMEGVEYDFWTERFYVYNQWRDDLWAEYLKKGYLHTLTGFTVQGLLDKKQVSNYPIQGSAYHWLLWCLVELNAWRKRHRLKSYPIVQVHDSILWDIYPPEKDYIIEKMKQVMSVDIRKRFPWIIVPLEVDIEQSPIDGSWYDKQ